MYHSLAQWRACDALSVLFPSIPIAACGQSAPDPRGVDRHETLLTVSATGRAATRPDEARYSLGVNHSMVAVRVDFALAR